jgi:hypothetical protein
VRISAITAPVRSTDLSLKLLVMVMSLAGSCTRSGLQVRACLAWVKWFHFDIG